MTLGRKRVPALVPRVRAVALALGSLPALWGQPGWVAETSHFRVVVSPADGIGPEEARQAGDALESFRSILSANGVGVPMRSDGPLEVLVVPNKVDLHALLRESPESRTRGITVRGMERDYAVVPWHGIPGPRVTLAHEYAHQFDRPGWPLWFREGRAVYLARESVAASDAAARLSLIDALDTADWLDWERLMSAQRGDAIASDRLFQAQAWLMVHWLARERPDWSPPDPSGAERLLATLGPQGVADTLRGHLFGLLRAEFAPALPVLPPVGDTLVREAEAWEVPLFVAEVRRELRHFDLAELALREIVRRHPDQPRAHAALGSLLVLLDDSESAERALGRALELGDGRARTAYRYAQLMMRPGEDTRARSTIALTAALRAVRRGPADPSHRLALAHARMLAEQWSAVFSDLRALARLPGWRARAEREAAEARRRRVQSLRAVQAPRPELAPIRPVPVALPRRPDPWRERPARVAAAPARRHWPPRGTWLIHGRIAWVDCSGGTRTVIVHSPFGRYALVENPDRPPALFNRPFRARAIPCETRGYAVAVAYRRFPAGGEHHGELAGIRF